MFRYETQKNAEYDVNEVHVVDPIYSRVPNPSFRVSETDISDWKLSLIDNIERSDLAQAIA